MDKRMALPAGIIVIVAALCVIQLTRAEPRGLAYLAPCPASGVGISSSGQYLKEAAFLKENGAAMDKMMAGMNVRPTGDVDADFAATMIPHHQGAIDMAVTELRYGKNEQLRRISQEIIVDQQQEIAAMRLALGLKSPAATPAPTQVPASAEATVSIPGSASNSPGSMSPSMTMRQE